MDIDIRKVQLDKLPLSLFKSDVEFYLLWFLKNDCACSFSSAMFQRQLQKYRHGKCSWHRVMNRTTAIGYLGSRTNPSPYRATHPHGKPATALWWRGWSKPAFSSFYEPLAGWTLKDEPFRLTIRGEARANEVWRRVRMFLSSLVDDLKPTSVSMDIAG